MQIKKIAFWVVVIFFAFVINSLLHSIISFSQKEKLIVNKEQQLAKEKKENILLKQQLAQARKPQFVEEEARDKLFLAKPGEGILIIPTPGVNKERQTAIKKQDTRQNWRQWWDLFF